jgi:hypothetical protein
MLSMRPAARLKGWNLCCIRHRVCEPGHCPLEALQIDLASMLQIVRWQRDSVNWESVLEGHLANRARAVFSDSSMRAIWYSSRSACLEDQFMIARNDLFAVGVPVLGHLAVHDCSQRWRGPASTLFMAANCMPIGPLIEGLPSGFQLLRRL